MQCYNLAILFPINELITESKMEHVDIIMQCYNLAILFPINELITESKMEHVDIIIALYYYKLNEISRLIKLFSDSK